MSACVYIQNILPWAQGSLDVLVVPGVPVVPLVLVSKNDNVENQLKTGYISLTFPSCRK